MLKEVVEQIESEGNQANYFTFEATSLKGCEALVASTVEKYGRLDTLVVSHGVGDGNMAEYISEEQWDKVIGIDLTSAFKCAQVAGTQMLKQGKGSIIFISSTASGLRGCQGGC